jgi:hypothetical protein
MSLLKIRLISFAFRIDAATIHNLGSPKSSLR